MIVTTKTTIAFELPKEYKQAVEYGEENPDWVRTEDTIAISYSQAQTYRVELREDGEA